MIRRDVRGHGETQRGNSDGAVSARTVYDKGLAPACQMRVYGMDSALTMGGATSIMMQMLCLFFGVCRGSGPEGDLS